MIDWTLDPRRRLLDRSLPLPGGFPGGSWLPGRWFGGRSGGGCCWAVEGKVGLVEAGAAPPPSANSCSMAGRRKQTKTNLS